MDLRHLRTFEVLAELLNFTRAAEALGYAQSSVTAQIKVLEEEVGQPLFERLGKRVTLTEAGRRFRPYAARMLALASEARQATQEGPEFRGTLRVGASESVCAFRLPGVLREYRERFPRVQLVLQSAFCNRLREEIRSGSVDVAFFLAEPWHDSELVITPLIQEQIAVVTYPWHPLALLERVTPGDMHQQPLVHTESDCPYRRVFDEHLAAAGAVPSVIMEFNSVEAVKQCVMAGLGHAVLPRVTCQAEFDQGMLVELPWAGPPIHMVTQVAYHRDKWISPPLAAFLEIIQRQLVR